MKKLLLLTILLSISIFGFTQNVDKIITTPIYVSYFSNQTHGPLLVSYKLYKGGGDSSRAGMSFVTDGQENSATSKDYAGNGYDIGHMANAEDFAYDPTKEKITFRFYNALPQTPKLNRGCWKVLETSIRKESQQDTILIICGGYDFTKKIGNCSVPNMCFKIKENLKTKVINYYLFANDDSDIKQELTKTQFFSKIPVNYTIIINKLLK